ncbi:MAG: peptidylprolyl isomerase [bacterium]
MFKENKAFWLYLLGIVLLFFLLFFGLRTYFNANGFIVGPISLNPFVTVAPNQVTPTYHNTLPDVTASIGPTALTITPQSVLDKDYYAVVKTNQGDFTVELFENNAPETVANFISLSVKDYYDQVRFHRLIPNVLLQGGSRATLDDDPANDKFGNPGYFIPDEINWSSLDFSDSQKQQLIQAGYVSAVKIASKGMDKYCLAMAGSAPNTGGSQFFIVLGDKTDPAILSLQGTHTVFGEVIANKELIDSFNKINSDINDDYRPLTDLFIVDIQIFSRK